MRDNIKLDLQELGRGGMNWIHRAQDRDMWGALVNAVISLRVSYSAGKFLTNLEPVSFQGRTVLHEESMF